MRNEGDGRPLLLLDVDGPLNPYAAAPKNDARPHWKTKALVPYTEGRPFAWVDDELYDFSALAKWAADQEQAAA